MNQRGHPAKKVIRFNIDEIPSPTVIYIYSTDDVILNDHAFAFLEIDKDEPYALLAWKKRNPILMKMLIRCEGDSITDQKIQMMHLDGRQEIINYSLSSIMNPYYGKIFLILFARETEQNSIDNLSRLYSIKEEIIRLKPYLNRTGKTIHRMLMKDYFLEESKPFSCYDQESYQKDLNLIVETYPSLSQREAELCCLLKNDHDLTDIALITFRTPQSVSVTIYRINRKLNFQSRKELITKLKMLDHKYDTHKIEPEE